MSLVTLLLAGFVVPVQSTPTDLYLQLPKAHAALNAGKFAEAKPIYEAYVISNPYLGSQVRNLALCEFKLGEYEAAAKHYEEAANTFWNKWECLFGVANSFAMLKDKSRTIAALKVAKDAGWPSYMDAIHSADFAFLESDPEYRKIVGLPPQGTFSREQKWSYDLDFLLEESLRRHFSAASSPQREVVVSAQRAIKMKLAKLSDEEVLLEIHKFMTLFGDGHSVLVSPEFASLHGIEIKSALEDEVWPIKLRWFPEGFFVVAATESHKDLLGRKLKSIDNVEMEAVLAKLQAIISRDNSEWPKVMAPSKMGPGILYGLGITKNRRKAQFNLDGQTIELAASPRSGLVFTEFNATGTPARYRKDEQKPYWFERDAQLGAVYVRYKACVSHEDAPIVPFWHSVIAELDKHESDRLIVDMRGNGGGSGELVDALIRGLQSRPRFDKPGSIIALTDRFTFSAALYACGKLEGLGAIFIGEPTGGRPNFVGEFVPFMLPFSKTLLSVSNRYHQNSFMSDQRPYFAPRIVAELSFADWATNRDPAMDAISAYLAASGSKPE